MYYWTDLYLTRDVDDERMTRTFAEALHVGPAQVVIVRSVDADHEHGRDWLDRPDHRVLVQRSGREFLADDGFPVELSVGIPGRIEPEAELSALRHIARGLNTPFISDLERDEDDSWRLFLPHGHTFEVTVDDRDQFVLPAHAVREMARFMNPPSRIAS